MFRLKCESLFRLIGIRTQPTAKPEFIPVALLETATILTPAVITLRIAGAAIDVTPGFDPATLRAVVVALGAIPC